MSFLLVVLRKGATDPLIYGPWPTQETAQNRYHQLKLGGVKRVLVYEAHPCAGRKKFEVAFRVEYERDCPLTDHLLSILRYAPLGNKEIGKLERFNISDQTVKNHYTTIGRLISFHAGHSVLGRTSQLIYAIKQGWIDLDDVECWEAKCAIEEEE